MDFPLGEVKILQHKDDRVAVCDAFKDPCPSTTSSLMVRAKRVHGSTSGVGPCGAVGPRWAGWSQESFSMAVGAGCYKLVLKKSYGKSTVESSVDIP